MTDEPWPDGIEPPKAVIEAAAWATRFLHEGSETNEASEINLVALKAWFGTSRENREAFAKVMFSTPMSVEIRARIERTLGQSFPSAHKPPARIIPIEAGRTAEPGGGGRPHDGSRRVLKIGATAAACAAVLALAISVAPPLTRLSIFSSAEAQVYRTGHGDIRSFDLADGSNLTLDTDSRVKVIMDSARRHAMIEEGRARFVVKADERPFTIEAGAGKLVTSKGTLDVSMGRDRRVDLQLRAGMADLRDGEEGKDAVARMLTIGQPITYQAGAFEPRPVAAPIVDTRNWPEGWVDYRTIPLAGLIGEANRYAKTPIIIDDPALASLGVTGSFRLTDTDGFVKRVAELCALKVTKKADGIHLSRK
ncbi:putative FecR [Novosphingobium resinovorum]|uniref:Putative FecR n=1 Tax=Novosphingobium resinovorum TaxID=158500 RepID=A0A031JZN6_9SPHN|nr:FecR domain-containing protein [Novosphingobium resinovorum]EZP82435.1 putative FecR [Novosphingobium resinovorum]